jgi:hypothetical protein
MASLKPVITESESGEDILQYLSEVKLAEGEKGFSITTDHMEEKKIILEFICFAFSLTS